MEAEKLISVSSIDHHEKDDDNEDGDQAALLPGFRFHPTDQELVEFYLRRKVEKRPAKTDLIKLVDVYKYDPWDLPKVVNRVGEREWYFFCRRGRKYKNSIRPNRVTGSGFWKATGIDKPIYSLGEEEEDEEEEEEKDCIGLKKSLVYYRGSAGKGTKTDWMMHEFRLPPDTKTSTVNTTQEAEVWTLCRIFKREASHRRCTPDWRRKFSSEQSYSNSSSKASYSESEIQNKYHLSGIEKKPAENDSLCNGNRGQLSLTTQVPFMASHLNFATPNGVVENFAVGNWDELGRMVEFSPDQSVVYGLR